MVSSTYSYILGGTISKKGGALNKKGGALNITPRLDTAVDKRLVRGRKRTQGLAWMDMGAKINTPGKRIRLISAQ